MQLALKQPVLEKIRFLQNLPLILALFLFLKVGLGLWGVFFVTQYHNPSPKASAQVLYEQIIPGGFQQGQTLTDLTVWPWFRWDTEWYITIALHGYTTEGSASFAPIYPLLIRLISLTGLNPMTSALLVSNIALILCCLLLYQEALERFDAKTASRTILYFLLFPSAVYLFAGYTEGLFTLFVLFAWRAGHKQRWLWMSILGALAILTRFQGVGLLVPLAFIWWKQRKTAPWQGLFLLIIPATVALWTLIVKFGLHAEFPWGALQGQFEAYYAWPWYPIWRSFQALTGPHPCISDFMDFSLTMLFIGLTVIAAFKLPGEYSLLMAAVLGPSIVKVAFDMPLMSMSRYLLPLFPGFLLLAHFGRKPLFHWLWLIFSLTLMALAAAGFFLWQWVA